MNKIFTIGVLALGIVFIFGNTMADQRCRDVNLKIKNEFGKQIRVTKINYRDKEDKKWRDNDLNNKEIANGLTGTVEETLEYVGNEEIPKMQFQFQYREDDGDWSDRQWSNVTDGLGGDACVRYKNYDVSISSSDTKK